LARQAMVEGSLLSYRCGSVRSARGDVFDVGIVSHWRDLAGDLARRSDCQVCLKRISTRGTLPARSSSGHRSLRCAGVQRIFTQFELAGREHGAADRPGQDKNSKVRPASTHLADIRRKLSNSRLRCSCSAFEFATAREKHRPPASSAVKWPVTDIEAPSPSLLGWTRRNGVSRSARTDCSRQKFQRAGGLAPSSSGVLPSDDRRLTVLHRREGGPASIYFARASQATANPVAVRRAEHFGIGGVFFRTEETPLGGDACADANCAYA
jgi:hypothetical protein